MTTLWLGCFGTSGTLLSFDVAGAALSEPRQSLDVASPAWLVDTDFGLWAVEHEAESGVLPVTLAAHAARTGTTTPTHGQDACHGALNAAGTALAVAQYSSGSLAVVPVDGSSAGEPLLLTFRGHSGVVADRQEASHAHQVTWLDGQHLLVCDLGADCVRVVRFDGVLSEVGRIDTTPGSGPRHLVLRSIGDHVEFAVCGELDGSVQVFRHEGGDWSVGWHPVTSAPGSLIGGNQPSGLREVNQHTLVLANRAINTLSIIEWTGDCLAVVDEFDCGGVHPRDVVVHEGRIWVANMESGDVCAFENRDAWHLVGRIEVNQPAALLFRD